MHASGTARTRINTGLVRQRVHRNVAVRAEVKVTGEYNEGDGKVSVPNEVKDAAKNADGTYYIDELDVRLCPCRILSLGLRELPWTPGV